MNSAPSDKRIPVWLDCDPGHDDAFAILMCAHHPCIEFLGISTVHGNASLDHTTRNASSVLIALGRTDVPIHPGASKPFCRHARHAPDIHGASGLDGTDLLPPPLDTMSSPARTAPAVTAMYDAIMAQPVGEAWIVATGTLTNVALLLAVYPQVGRHLAGISVMGGAIGGGQFQVDIGRSDRDPAGTERIGNVTRWAEFNIHCDPEAAKAVLENPGLGGKIILIPLDITHTVLATTGVCDDVLKGSNRQSTSKLRRMMHDLLLFFAGTYESVFNITTGPPLHDPVAVAAVLHKEGVHTDLDFKYGWFGPNSLTCQVSVLTTGQHEDDSQLGRTIASPSLGNSSVWIPYSLDVTRFWNYLNQCLARAETLSPLGYE